MPRSLNYLWLSQLKVALSFPVIWGKMEEKNWTSTQYWAPLRGLSLSWNGPAERPSCLQWQGRFLPWWDGVSRFMLIHKATNWRESKKTTHFSSTVKFGGCRLAGWLAPQPKNFSSYIITRLFSDLINLLNIWVLDAWGWKFYL